LADVLLELSPLTSILHHPCAGKEDETAIWVDDFRTHPDGRRILVRTFSECPDEPAAITWRQQVLDSLWSADKDDRAFVLDVYEGAIVYHGKRWMQEIRAAWRILSDPLAASDSTRLRRSVALARWWEPLQAIRRSWPDELRERRHLDFRVYLEGLRLASLASTFRIGEA
jgi:hypothetical protein